MATAARVTYPDALHRYLLDAPYACIGVVDYYFKLPGLDYLVSGILVLIISMLVGFLFSKRIRRMDMVETLKGME